MIKKKKIGFRLKRLIKLVLGKTDFNFENYFDLCTYLLNLTQSE